MVKKMLINACHPEECRVAVVADGLLEELDVQVNTREATLGNIYKGAVTRVEPSLQAVFVDYGGPRNGFLSINDVHPSYFSESFEASKRRPRIQDVFKKDDHVIVQVAKEERSSKGASLTTNISVAGRYLVLMPGTDLCGVSRKIEDEKERKKLKELLQQLKLPENIGFIIRTAGMGRTKTELSRDLDYLLKLWNSIEKNVVDQPAPALLYREHDMVIRAIREHFSPDICELLVDDKEVHKTVREFFHQVMPKYESLVKLYQEKRPLFNKYQLEEQIEQVYSKRIKLKSGGSIVIEPTEALVTIDVNSGGAIKEKGIEETAFKVNMEAAPEIARQLRLRDLGGIIVVDFIDMSQKKHKQEVEKTIKAALKFDRAKNKILRISALGLLELSRQRLKSSLGTGEYRDCPTCDGAGKIRSAETSALAVFRRIKSLLIRSDVNEVKATLPPKVAEYLLNTMRSHLVELESQYSSKITIHVGHGIADRDVIVEAIKEESLEAPFELAIAPPPSHPAVLPAPSRPAAAPPQPEPVTETSASPEEALAEEEKKKAKKPGRRRRRTKKKATTETENGLMTEEVLLSELPADSVEEQPVEAQPEQSEEIVVPAEQRLEETEKSVDDDAETFELSAEETTEETSDVATEELVVPAEQVFRDAVEEDGAVSEPLYAETMEQEAFEVTAEVSVQSKLPIRPTPADPEEVVAMAETVDVETEVADEEQPKEAPESDREKTGKDKRTTKKTSLQNYLPFQ